MDGNPITHLITIPSKKRRLMKGLEIARKPRDKSLIVACKGGIRSPCETRKVCGGGISRDIDIPCVGMNGNAVGLIPVAPAKEGGLKKGVRSLDSLETKI
jgi:hypothetical protein